MKINLKVDRSRLEKRVDRLSRQARNMSPAFAEISELMVSAIEKNFQDEGRYQSADSPIGGGRKWPELSDKTKAQRSKEGKWPGKKLQVSGQLAASISADHGADYAQAGTNKPYAAIQHYGGKAGRGRKVTIPARPYMHLQPGDIQEANDIIREHLTNE